MCVPGYIICLHRDSDLRPQAEKEPAQVILKLADNNKVVLQKNRVRLGLAGHDYGVIRRFNPNTGDWERTVFDQPFVVDPNVTLALKVDGIQKLVNFKDVVHEFYQT